ncbi:uncharacterized protein LOC103393015 [Cynoglossus semilaevis]|uniref:uncharacterized protein LOC103393015 n=1 Tax=Cynoglossus semilaevis TaxID=244447 RepID=UPI0004973275|nr:uncharacterized protein LOC103393015 [Cynoglossus semilaevis]
MALGQHLWVSWICLLLFNCAAGILPKRGYVYPHKHDSKNILDEEEELMMSLSFDDADATYGQSPDGAHGGYNQPSVTVQPDPVLPDAAGTLGSGQFEAWGEPLLFPLNLYHQLGDPAQPPQQPVQSQLPYNAGASPGTDGAAYNSPAAPVSPSQAENVYPQSGSEHSAAGDSGSSITAGDLPHVPRLVYEEVFQYPSSAEESAKVYTAVDQTQPPPSQPLVPNHMPAVELKPVSPPGKGSSPTGKKVTGSKQNTYSAQYKPATTKRTRPVMNPKYAVLPRKTSYIIQSRGGYQRRKSILSSTLYSPDLYPSLPVRKPAAPKVAKTPQSTKQ